MRFRPLVVALAIVVVVSSFPASPARAAETPERAVLAASTKRPALHGFEENLGQLDPRAAFAARSDAGTLFVTSSGAVFTWARSSPAPDRPLVDQFTGYSPGLAPGLAPPSGGTTGFVGWRFVGVDPEARLTGEAPMRADVHRICGSATRPAGTPARVFERVRQTGVYPGIDALHYEGARGFEYDLIVHPCSDPGRIAMAIDGASSVSIDAEGALVLSTPSGDVRHQAPVAYQMRDGEREPVACRYQLGADHSVKFALASYDRSRELVIDPVILSSLIFGGTDAEFSYNIAADNFGNSYLVGTTYSLDFPTVLPLQPAYGGNPDVYVAKVGPDGRTLLWTTYLGGSGFDFGAGIAVDDLGRVYVSGTTSSATFPVTAGSFQPQIRGGSDAFLIRLSPDGQTVEYGTFIGGTGADSCNGLALDSSLNVAIIGSTNSTNYPVKNAFQATNRGVQDGFVTVVNAGGGSLAYSTYAGGSLLDIPFAVDVDSSGNVYAAGYTQSTNFPTLNGFQSTFQGGAFDTFAIKLSPAGEYLYGSYLGGSGNDIGFAIAADDNGGAFVGGFTESSDFPLQSPFQDTLKGASDGLLAQLPMTGGTTPDFSTYFGGEGFDGFYSLVFVSGRLYGVGRTNSGTSFPSVDPVPGTVQGPIDTFYVVIDPVGQKNVEAQLRGVNGFELAGCSVLGDGTNQNVTGCDSPEEGLNWGVTYFQGAQDLPTSGISDAFERRVGGNVPVRLDLAVGLGVSPVVDGKKYVVTLIFRNLGVVAIRDFEGVLEFDSSVFAQTVGGTSTGVKVDLDRLDTKRIYIDSLETLNPGQTKVVVLELTVDSDNAAFLTLGLKGYLFDEDGEDQVDDNPLNNTVRRIGRKYNVDEAGRPAAEFVGQEPWDANFVTPPVRNGISVSVVDPSVVLKAPLKVAVRDRAARPLIENLQTGIATMGPAGFDRLRYPGPTRGNNIYASTTPNFTPSPSNLFKFIPFTESFTDVSDAPAGSYFRATQIYGQAESSPSEVFGGPLPDVTKVKLAATKVIIDGTNFVGPVSVFFDGVPFESAAKLKKNDTRIQQKGLLATGETIGQYKQRRGRVVVTVTTVAGNSVHFYVE